jgi:Tol biopolymer transport system component
VRYSIGLVLGAVLGLTGSADAATTNLDDRQLDRSGTWKSVSNPNATGKTLSKSKAANAALSSPTRATQGGSVRFQVGRKRGKAAIVVGGKRTTVNTKAHKTGFKSVSFTGAGAVKIVVVKPRRGVYVDLLTLNGGSSNPNPTPTPTPTPTATATPKPSTTPTATATPVGTPPAVNRGALTQVNSSAGGTAQDGGDATTAAVSPDGKYVAFWTKATNLVPGVADGNTHLYLKTLATGDIRVFDSSKDGVLSNDTDSAGGTRPLAWAPDSSQIVFGSSATNISTLPAGIDDKPFLYSKNVSDNTVSVLVENATDAQWSPDGKKIAFGSKGNYCFNNDPKPCTPNGTTDAQLYSLDIASSKVSPISASATGAFPADSSGPSSSYRPVWSPDSASVAFVSDSRELVTGDTNNNPDVFIKNIGTGAITRASVTSAGAQLNNGSDWPAYSPDGTQLAYDSTADNIIAGDNNSGSDIFVRTIATGATTVASAKASGEFVLFGNRTPKWSPDGKKLAFTSGAVDLIPGFVDDNQRDDIYIRDMATGTYQVASARADGVLGSSASTTFGLYGSDGGWLPDSTGYVFLSRAANLAAADGNATAQDVFLKRLQ